LKRWVWIVAVLCLLAIGGLAGGKLRQSPKHRLHPNTEATAIVVMLGGFRGIIADLLWYRLAALQEQGQYLELMQLAEWITMLEPDNGDVWVYQAWNLSYNVANMMSRPTDRWRWVLSGMELLRDRGFVMNPGDAKIRRELGWVFQNKLGSDMDTAAPYYREQWATLMQEAGIEPPNTDGESGLKRLLEDAALRNAFEQRFKMNVATMQMLDAEFGTLDWRLPWTHAMYWGWGAATLNVSETQRLAAKRLVYQSIMLQVKWSTQRGDAADQKNAARLLEGGIRYLQQMITEHDFSGVRMAYAGMLFDGARLEYRRGNMDAARGYYNQAMVVFAGIDGSPAPSFEDIVR